MAITDKTEIVKKAKEYLKENHFIDLYWFIYDDMSYNDVPESFVRDVAFKMVASGNYEMIYTDYQKHFYLIKKKWFFRHPLTYSIIVLLLSILLSLLVSQYTKQGQSQSDYLREYKQDSLLHILTNQIKNLQEHKADSSIPSSYDTIVLKRRK